MMKVVNRHSERFQIYIGRGTMWGNPYIIGRDGSREVVLDKYRNTCGNVLRTRDSEKP